MKKKARRVSFSLPEVEKEEEEAPQVNISVQEHDSLVDDDVETMGGDESDESDSDSEVSEDLDEEDSLQNGTELENGHAEATRARKGLNNEGIDSDVSESDASDASSDESSSEESESEADEDEPNIDSNAPKPISTFSEMALDPRVDRAITRMGWKKPTPVQSAVIPAALSGRDVLVSAPTGSGKTAAYAVPIVQHICQSRNEQPGVKAVILVPTRELVQQVTAVVKGLCKYIEGTQVAAITSRKVHKKSKGRKGKSAGNEKTEECASFSQTANVVVGTPASIIAAVDGDRKSALANVEFVVVDEADLVLSYGYEGDAREALANIPSTSQAILVSATLEAEGMDSFRRVVLRRPLTIKVTADADMKDGDPAGASHYYANLKNRRDRYLVTYAMLRLNVITGKVLIFVNNINAAFRLKLFLDQFKVKTAVLNSELPANSRMHCVEQFNAGVVDILIATDESKSSSNKEKSALSKDSRTKKRKRVEKDAEFGLSRGVDFRDVAAVFNFDLPESVTSYTHRAGRTARAGKSGTVLSLVCDDDQEISVKEMGRELGVPIGPLAFRMDQIEAFRYRVEDCLRLVTDRSVVGARLADVRREIVNSEQLKDYFEDNPHDLDALQHNLSLAKNVSEHLAHIPSYLLPAGLHNTVAPGVAGRVSKTKRKRGIGAGANRGSDPLKSFTTKGNAGSSRARFQAKHGITKRKKTATNPLVKRRRMGR